MCTDSGTTSADGRTGAGTVNYNQRDPATIYRIFREFATIHRITMHRARHISLISCPSVEPRQSGVIAIYCWQYFAVLLQYAKRGKRDTIFYLDFYPPTCMSIMLHDLLERIEKLFSFDLVRQFSQ